jgi:putative DNA primase/helicase
VQGLRHGFGDYYTQIPVKALLGSHQEHDTVLMVFKGARLAVLEETPEEGRLSYQQLKQITAPQITGRLMHQNYVTYDTTHAAMISTNHEPAAESADHGSLRRVQVSQPPADFPEDPPASYQAWHGVRFKNEEDLKAEEKDAAP